MGHARALLTIPDPALQLKLYNEILKNDLSVRKVEKNLQRHIRKARFQKVPEAPKNTSRYTSGDFDILKKHLSSTFNTSVGFKCDNTGKGMITFSFKGDEELERLIALFDTLKSQQ